MCGIALVICDESSELACQEEVKLLENGIRRRGPDLSHSVEVQLTPSTKGIFYGYVLWLQGSTPTAQPSELEGNILLWNGDSYSGIARSPEDSDTCTLLENLSQSSCLPDILHTIELIHGPWCIVFYSPKLQKVFIGRDSLGRHSLLWNVSAESVYLPCTGQPLIVSSLAKDNCRASTYTEVPSYGLFVYDLSTRTFQCHPWSHLTEAILTLNVQPSSPTLQSPYFAPLCKTLPSATDLVDWSSIPEGSEREFVEYQIRYPDTLSLFETLLQDAVKLRLTNQPPLCRNCVSEFISASCKHSVECDHVKTAVLFSGGLDSVVLAALLDRILPAHEPVDLYNVAFEQLRKTSKVPNPDSENFQVPDRLSGLDALEELKALNPLRPWNFLKVNVSLKELVEARLNHVAGLIYPSTTVLDDSIGCAQWFAAKGEGLVEIGGIHQPYTSSARVVLMGAGADEQLGGYSRHRVKFSSSENWSSLTQELDMEMCRISSRNLGRDNRVISDHGRALRLPFLDENVVAMLARIPVWQKADLRLKPGVGDKILLRTLAWKLGLKRTAIRVKRAIQFGSRIAKAESRHEKGADLCSRLIQPN